MQVRPEIMNLLAKSQGDMSGSGVVGGALIGGTLMGGALIGGKMKAGKLPLPLRQSLAKHNPDYKERVEKAYDKYKENKVLQQYQHPKGSEEALRRGALAAETRKANTEEALRRTKKFIRENSAAKLSPQEVNVIYKENKRIISAENRKMKAEARKEKKEKEKKAPKKSTKKVLEPDTEEEEEEEEELPPITKVRKAKRLGE